MLEAGSTEREAVDEGAVIAAVDLGSNSFHMVVATLRHGQITIIDRLRETVRLAEGLTADGELSVSARARALDCLSRFGERLRGMKAGSVRAVGTNTMRRTRADSGFLNEAASALGHPIEVISGVEEARLIYLGVAHSLPPEDGRRLVIDIGGGSTELIIGENLEAQTLESLGMGCVIKTERNFPDGVITKERFEAARVAARLKLRPIKNAFRTAGWQTAIGASGTIRATIAVAREQSMISGNELLRSEHVEELILHVVEAGHIDRVELPGLSQRRAQVWPGGLAILVEVIAALKIEGLMGSDGALREGVLYDLVGRLQHSDARVRSVAALGDRYLIDHAQASRVKKTASGLFDQVSSELAFDPDWALKMLRWAGHLHEIGLNIAHGDFHRHSAYVVGHADMPGFPATEQQMLAFLLGNQRKRPGMSMPANVSDALRASLIRLAIMLRLAVLLHRNRGDDEIVLPGIRFDERRLLLTFDADWLDANPLTRADLEREASYLANWDIDCILR
ncbi:MAG: exopolyphosphatase [Woeseiaceae bacterium]